MKRVTVADVTAPGATASPEAHALHWRPGSLTLRVASGVVAVPFLMGTAYFGGWFYGVVITAATILAGLELRGMLRAAGYAPLTLALVGLAAWLPLDGWFLGGSLSFQVTIAVLMLSLVVLLGRRTSERAIVDWALSLALALYVGGLMQFYAPLRQRPDGAFWVMALLGLSWVCDSAAFFFGRAYGRTPLAPHISPRKSREGAVAGLLASAIVGGLVAMASGHSASLVTGYGAVIGLATVVGDLAESLLKRQTGVKDSGILIPGHGGILDRMDSLLFCAPIAVLYLQAFSSV
jgi:phosphatidate cytidylyltransferase